MPKINALLIIGTFAAAILGVLTCTELGAYVSMLNIVLFVFLVFWVLDARLPDFF